ncbi:MAG: hypothetical protein C6H99_04450 [Epsilonproteobacteria bacterium]|nr:hypothetical protein [Campylobacterota bacterium]NPA64685.1 tetratricopeptide repeat protein [Campylobacterota bacterium]
MDKQALLRKAGEHFMKREYQEALDIFLHILRQEPQNKEALMGAMLCDLLEEDEEEAVALYDFYLVLKEEGEKDPEAKVMEMVRQMDEADENMMRLEEELRIQPLLSEGISYEDFKEIVTSRGSFKRAFEDIMFSTKVIITKKSDFFDFIENLIEHGFIDMVYSYLEDATKLYPTDKRLQYFFDRLSDKA